MDITDDRLDAFRKQEEERRLEQLHHDIRALMATESGRRLAWWLLETSGVYQSSYRDNAQAMAYAEGKRAFGLMFLQHISALAPKEYLTMQQEASNGRLEREHRRQHAIDSATD